MKLIYCIAEGFSSAVEFGWKTWGRDASGDDPKKFHGPINQARVLSGELEVKAFGGVVVEIDNAWDGTFVKVRDSEGGEREFHAENDSTLYEIGKRMLVRYVELSRLKSGTMIDVFEIWLEV